LSCCRRCGKALTLVKDNIKFSGVLLSKVLLRLRPWLLR
jgi:hypothetical protein